MGHVAASVGGKGFGGKMRWMGHVAASLGGKRFWWKNLKDLDHLEDVGVDGNILSKHILNKQLGECALVSSGSG
jgi:hypothetical protein